MKLLKIFNVFGIAALGVAGFNSTSYATVLLQDNFDSYPDQASFEAAWTPIGTVAPISATLANDQASSSPNSIRVDGTATSGQQRNQRLFTESGLPNANSISFSFDFFDSNDAAAPYRQYSNIQDTTAPSGTSQLISMGLNNNQSSSQSGGNYYMARILGYAASTVADPDGGPAESVGSSSSSATI